MRKIVDGVERDILLLPVAVPNCKAFVIDEQMLIKGDLATLLSLGLLSISHSTKAGEVYYLTGKAEELLKAINTEED